MNTHKRQHRNTSIIKFIEYKEKKLVEMQQQQQNSAREKQTKKHGKKKIILYIHKIYMCIRVSVYVYTVYKLIKHHREN